MDNRLLRPLSAFNPGALPGFLWDSGENPANGSDVPSSFSVDLSTAEIWMVSRGHGGCPLELGAGSQAMYYAGGMNYNASQGLFFFDGGGPRTLKSGCYWPRLMPTIHGYRGDGASSLKAFLNGEVFGATGSGTPTTTGGKVGQDITFSGGFAYEGEIKRVLIYSANLSEGQRGTLLTYLRTRYGIGAYEQQVVCDGDSITAGYNSVDNFVLTGWSGRDYTHSYPYYVAAGQPTWKCLNHGTSSQTLANLAANAAAAVDPYFDAVVFSRNVCILFAGTNDLLGGATLASVENNTQTYVSDRQAVGWKVVVVPILDRYDFSAGQRADKDMFNAWLAAGNSGADAVALLPASLAGNSAWVSNPSKWDVDQTHLSRAGYQDLAGSVTTAVLAA